MLSDMNLKRMNYELVYCLKPTPNVVVVFGGYKKNQEKDVKRLYKIVEEVKDEIEELIKEKK